MGSIQDLVATWRAKGVRLEPPATESELAALEAAFGVRLPRDVREFYLEANGMSDLEYDDHEMSFWSISKILSDPGRSEGQDPNGAFSDFPMADFLLDSCFLSFRVRSGSVSLFLEGTGEEFANLSSFVSRYLEAPESLSIL
jgi:hypothetical protein